MRESKKSEGGAFKAPPPPGSYRVNGPVSPMLTKKSLKASAICFGSEIKLPFANLNSCGKSCFFFRRFSDSFIVCQVFFKLVEYELNTVL